MGKAPGKELAKVNGSSKVPRDPVQVAALPYQVVDGELRVLLVTSRGTRRWIIPKGWPMKGKKRHRAAEQEALEEAGAKGRVARRPFGQYEAWKRLSDHFVLCTVDVFPLLVRRQRKRWLEQHQRHAAWFKAEDAADLVEEPGLRALIVAFHRAQRSEASQRQVA